MEFEGEALLASRKNGGEAIKTRVGSFNSLRSYAVISLNV